MFRSFYFLYFILFLFLFFSFYFVFLFYYVLYSVIFCHQLCTRVHLHIDVAHSILVTSDTCWRVNPIWTHSLTCSANELTRGCQVESKQYVGTSADDVHEFDVSIRLFFLPCGLWNLLRRKATSQSQHANNVIQRIKSDIS